MDHLSERICIMKIITISREFGAGGHSIGTKVANELGIELYDRDIIRETARVTDTDYAQIQKAEEGVSRTETLIRRITPISYEYKDYLFNAQKEVILDIARKGACVIIGRCAEVILREAGIDALHVFLYADEEHRAAWVRQHFDMENRAEAIKFMHRQDRGRKAYYDIYTDAHFGDPHNYDLMLDSGSLGYDTCAELIIALANA